MSSKQDWVWMPHPGHFIGSRDCKFFMNTYVGKYIVSTVGEYFPDSRVREILASCRKIEIVGSGDAWDADYMRKIGYERIGWDRKYETMVFTAKPSDDECKCCPYVVDDYGSLDADGYNEARDAYNGHLALCEKWSKEEVE